MTDLSAADLRQGTPATLAWQREQDAAATAALRALPAYPAFTDLLDGLLEPSRVFAPVRRGKRWFWLQDLDPSAEQPALVTGAEPGLVERVLVDPDALTEAAGAPVSIASWGASPAGSYLAYAVAEGGDERPTLHVLDVATGVALPEALPFIAAGAPRWLADESGFWVASREVDDTTFTMSLRLHRLGGAAAAAEDAPLSFFPQPVPSPDGRWVVGVCGNTQLRADAVRGPDGEWRRFLADLPGGSVGTVAGDSWVAVLDGEHPHGRLVRVPFDSADDPSTWEELLAPSDDVLRQVALVGDDLVVVGYLRDAASGVRVLRLDGSLVEDLDLPGRGMVTSVPFAGSTQLVPMVDADADGFSFLFTSFTQSPTAYRWEPETGLRELAAPQRSVEGVVVSLHHAVSPDGTRVPVHVLRAADAEGPLPTLLYGYGGFNVGLLPSYRPDALAWVRAGGAFALAHLRGGSELGRTWWLAGRMSEKQNVFDDLYAVAAALVEQGVAASIAVTGASNGGLLTGVAITQRPDLWAAVVSEIPVLDLLDTEGEPLSAAVIASEYGNPADPEQRSWLEAYSPLQHVRAGEGYPPLLVVSGENDPRCPPWHGRLFTQRMRQAGGEVLLRVPEGQGHGAAQRSAAAAQRAEALAFCAAHTGLVPALGT